MSASNVPYTRFMMMKYICLFLNPVYKYVSLQTVAEWSNEDPWPRTCKQIFFLLISPDFSSLFITEADEALTKRVLIFSAVLPKVLGSLERLGRGLTTMAAEPETESLGLEVSANSCGLSCSSRPNDSVSGRSLCPDEKVRNPSGRAEL